METKSLEKTFGIDPKVCQKAARYAVHVYEEMSKRSKLLNNEDPHVVALFHKDEVIPYIGELLGKGGFNNVYELEQINLTHECSYTQLQRQQLVNRKPKLAVKFLSDEALADQEDACNGGADLLMEAKYLQALAAHPHPAIIRLHGVCSAGPSGFAERAGYFLIIDRLVDTLDNRIEVWKELRRRKLNDKSAGKYLKVLFLQQLLTACEIVGGLRHLHKLDIIFRDLKPDNVGFTEDNRVKLFDFGLAKELDPKQKVSDVSPLFHMSGGTGSRRYMAPEVHGDEPYGLSADLYSFSIVLWEILTCEKAFGKLSTDAHKELVIEGTLRPEMDPSWRPSLIKIFAQCWCRNPLDRWSAGQSYNALRKEIHELVKQEFPAQAATEERRRIMV